MLRARLTEPGGTPVPTERTARELLAALGSDRPARRRRGRAHRGAARRARRAPDAAAARRRGRRRAGRRLLPDSPDCLVVAVSGGPADRRPRRPALHPGRPGHQAGRRTARPGTPARSASPWIRGPPRHSSRSAAGQPAALVLVGGWLAARPEGVRGRRRPSSCDGLAVTERRRPARAAPSGSSTPPCPQPAARMLRLLALAPAGLADPHTASALAGCSVAAAQATLDDFAALRPRCGAPHRRCRSTRCPAVSLPCCAARWRAHGPARPRCSWPGPGCWSGPYGSCSPAGRSPRPDGLAGPQEAGRHAARAALRPAGAAAEWLDARLPALLAAARLAVARRGAGHPGPPAGRRAGPGAGRAPGHRGRPPPSSTGCTSWCSMSPSAAGCTGSRPPRC